MVITTTYCIRSNMAFAADVLACESQLIEFVDDVTNNMVVGKQTDIMIMDFSMQRRSTRSATVT